MVLWGRSRDELHHWIYSKQPIREWEGQPPHKYGEIIHSSVVSLYNSYTQVTWRHPRESAGSYEVWPHRCFIREEHILRCRLRMRWQQQSQYPTLIKRLISVFKATPSLVLNTKRHRLTADGASDQTVWELNTMSEWSYRWSRCLFFCCWICVTCLRSVLQGSSEHFLVLFSFHLLILSLDHSRQEFIYEVFLVDFTLKRQ